MANGMTETRTQTSWKNHSKVQTQLKSKRRKDTASNDPRNMRTPFYIGDDVARLARQVYADFNVENPLYGNVLHPSLAAMSSDVIAMALQLFGAAERGAGTFTTSQTECNTLAARTARDWARANHPTPGVPEILMGHGCHASFDKAAEVLGMKVVRLPPNPEHRVDAEVMRHHITENTVMLIGSAPAYPVGSLDPIVEIASLALSRNLWMHVDGFFGGFILPFVKDFENLPPFDFSVNGVRSMSTDLHKYGFASRGASLHLLANQKDEVFQRLQVDRRNVGKCVAMTANRSKPDLAAAAAWAVMSYLGHSGYRERAQKIVDVRRALEARVEAIDGLRVLGKPCAGFFAIGGAGSIDMEAVCANMKSKGWHFTPLRAPVGMNLSINVSHEAIVDRFDADIKAAIVAA